MKKHEKNIQSDFHYCDTLVRLHRKDAYFLSHFAPNNKFQKLIALHAFEYEIDSILSLTHEPIATQIRYQWWWDCLQSIKDKASQTYQHPVLRVLNNEEFDVSLLEKMIAGKEQFIEKNPPRNKDDLLKRLIKDHHPLFLCMAGGENKGNIAYLKNLAALYGLVTMIRRIPFDAKRGIILIPTDMFTKKGNISDTGIAELKPESEAFRTVIKSLCDTAEALVIKFHDDRRESKKLGTSNSSSHLWLYGHLAEIYLRDIRKRNYDVFDARLLKTRPFFTEIKIALKYLF